jgi:hypothetical protein
VESAVSRGIAIVPFRIEDVQPSTSLNYFVESIHWLDAVTPPLERHLQTLAETVRLLLTRQCAGGVGGAQETVPADIGSGSPPMHGEDGALPVPRRRPWPKAVIVLLGTPLVLAMVYFAWWAVTRSTRTPTESPGAAPSAASNAGTAGRVPSPEPKMPRSQNSQQDKPSEPDAVRRLIDRYYELLVKKDENGVMALYSQATGATDLEECRNSLHSILVDTGKIDLKQLLIERLEVEGNIAKARVTVLFAATEVLSGKPYFPSKPFVFNWEMVEEEDGWKLLHYSPAEK